MRITEINHNLWPVLYGIKTLLRSPSVASKEIFEDLKKDGATKKGELVWVAGLPKSGTTMIEEILDFSGYVQGNKSVLRKFAPYPLDHDHGISHGHFKFFPKNKKTFIKTHSHFDQKYMEIAKVYNPKIIISIRDIRDMMISRYFHIISQESHWQHKSLIDLPELEGFKLSCVERMNIETMRPIDYYHYWISEWSLMAARYDALIVWYEDYLANSHSYLNKIIRHIGSNKNSQDIESKLDSVRIRAAKYQRLEDRRSMPGRTSSTFRHGGTSWRNFLDSQTLDWFMNELKTEVVLYEK
ncbi:sulfotransferase domain-containing protein [Alphaproteobacteria bacterium LSUCC0744]